MRGGTRQWAGALRGRGRDHLPLDGEGEASGGQQRRDRHEHLEALGALLPQIVVGLAVLLAKVGEDAFEMQTLVDAEGF